MIDIQSYMIGAVSSLVAAYILRGLDRSFPFIGRRLVAAAAAEQAILARAARGLTSDGPWAVFVMLRSIAVLIKAVFHIALAMPWIVFAATAPSGPRSLACFIIALFFLARGFSLAGIARHAQTIADHQIKAHPAQET